MFVMEAVNSITEHLNQRSFVRFCYCELENLCRRMNEKKKSQLVFVIVLVCGQMSVCV